MEGSFGVGATRLSRFARRKCVNSFLFTRYADLRWNFNIYIGIGYQHYCTSIARFSLQAIVMCGVALVYLTGAVTESTEFMPIMDKAIVSAEIIIILFY